MAQDLWWQAVGKNLSQGRCSVVQEGWRVTQRISDELLFKTNRNEGCCSISKERDLKKGGKREEGRKEDLQSQTEASVYLLFPYMSELQFVRGRGKIPIIENIGANGSPLPFQPPGCMHLNLLRIGCLNGRNWHELIRFSQTNLHTTVVICKCYHQGVI